jgi:hypothetical protein
MPNVIVPANISPVQIEGFPDVAERSVKGALYVLPASTLTLTEDEWRFLQDQHPELARQLIPEQTSPTLADLVKRKKAAAAPQEGQPQATPPDQAPTSPQEGQPAASGQITPMGGTAEQPPSPPPGEPVTPEPPTGLASVTEIKQPPQS